MCTTNKICFFVFNRKNRNLYVQILAQMLRRENIKEPFNRVPERGKLPTIPAYMVP